VDMGPGFWWCH